MKVAMGILVGVVLGVVAGLLVAAWPSLRAPDWSAFFGAPQLWGPVLGALLAVGGVWWSAWTTDHREDRKAQRDEAARLEGIRRETYTDLLAAADAARAAQHDMRMARDRVGLRPGETPADLVARLVAEGRAKDTDESRARILREMEGALEKSKVAVETMGAFTLAACRAFLVTDSVEIFDAVDGLRHGLKHPGEPSDGTAEFIDAARREFGRLVLDLSVEKSGPSATEDRK